jgi:hypothetical protein
VWCTRAAFQQIIGNPDGNRHRTRHLLNQEFMQALLPNFRHQGKQAIEQVARNQPAVYLKILALLVPREHKVEHSISLKDLTDEQLEAMAEYLKTSLEAQARGSVKVLEGTIEPAATTAPAPKPKNRLISKRTPRLARGSASRSARRHRLGAGDLHVWQVGTSDYGGRHRSARDQPSKPSDGVLD